MARRDLPLRIGRSGVRITAHLKFRARFREALAALFGDDAAGFSATNIARL
jgi:hypothetical protein